MLKMKKSKMKKVLNVQNLILLTFALASVVMAIVFATPISWLVCISSITGMLAVKTNTEGKWICFIFDSISFGTYIYVCFIERYYGEMILAIVIIIWYTISLFEWKKHEMENVVEVDHLKTREIVIITIITILFILGYALVLFKINSDMPLLNAIPTAMFLLGNYLCTKRSRFQFVFFALYEIFFIVLWVMAAINGDIGGAIFVVEAVSELIFCIIGIFTWNKMKSHQQTVKIEKQLKKVKSEKK